MSSGDSSSAVSYAVDCTKASEAARAFSSGKYSKSAELLNVLSQEAKNALDSAPPGVRGEVLPALLSNHAIALCAAAQEKDGGKARVVLSHALHDIEAEWRKHLPASCTTTLAFNMALADLAVLERQPSTILHALEQCFARIRDNLEAGQLLSLSDDTAMRLSILLASLYTHVGCPEAALGVLDMIKPFESDVDPELLYVCCSLSAARVKALLRLGDQDGANDTLRHLLDLPALQKAVNNNERGIIQWKHLAEAQAALLQGQEQKAMETISAIKNDMLPSIVYCDLACCASHMKKHATAAMLLERALRERQHEIAASSTATAAAQQQQQPPVTVFGEMWTLRTYYSLGVQLLFAGNPVDARKYIEMSRPLMEDDPKYWIRLAECCIAQHSLFEKGHAQDPVCNTTSTGVGAVVTVSKNAVFPPEVLAFGCQCCRNALLIITQYEDKDRSGAAGRPTAMSELKSTALVELAFLSLCANDPVSAWSASKQLFDVKNEAVRFFGNVYGAEALCMLGDPKRAIPHLSPEALANVQSASSMLSSSPYYSSSSATENSGNALKSAIYVNLAIAHVLMRDDVAQAYQCIQQAIALQPTPRAIYMHAYLELRMGNTENALELLRRGRQPPRRQPKKH